jgi:fructoselysine-6-P-deglycase FrlB-like protein
MTGAALEILNAERARQRGDAIASFAASRRMAAEIAAAIRDFPRLVMVGMGGSHFINRIVEPLYRRAGIETSAHTATELIAMPLPAGRRVALLTSQSGASSEIREYLARPPADERRFGLTLEPESPMAGAIPCLAGTGGKERSYAAARSVLVTLALHGAVLDALGQRQEAAMEWLARSRDIDTTGLVEALSRAVSFMVLAPACARGIADSTGLTLMELARLPVLALEYGQFRHGPLEALKEETGIILLRDGDTVDAIADEIAAFAAKAGSPTATLDLGGEVRASAPGRVGVPVGPGIAWHMAALLAGQALAIDLAATRVANVGEPRIGRKVM